MKPGGGSRDEGQRNVDNSTGLGISNVITALEASGPSNSELPFNDWLHSDYDGVLLPMSYETIMSEIDEFDWDGAGIASKLGEYCTGEANNPDPPPSTVLDMPSEMCEHYFLFTDRQMDQSYGLVDAPMTGSAGPAQCETRMTETASLDFHNVSGEAASQQAEVITSVSNEPKSPSYMPFIGSNLLGSSEATLRSLFSYGLDFTTADNVQVMDQEFELELNAAQFQPLPIDDPLQLIEGDSTEPSTPKQRAGKHPVGESRYVFPKGPPTTAYDTITRSSPQPSTPRTPSRSPSRQIANPSTPQGYSPSKPSIHELDKALTLSRSPFFKVDMSRHDSLEPKKTSDAIKKTVLKMSNNLIKDEAVKTSTSTIPDDALAPAATIPSTYSEHGQAIEELHLHERAFDVNMGMAEIPAITRSPNASFQKNTRPVLLSAYLNPDVEASRGGRPREDGTKRVASFDYPEQRKTPSPFVRKDKGVKRGPMKRTGREKKRALRSTHMPPRSPSPSPLPPAGLIAPSPPKLAQPFGGSSSQVVVSPPLHKAREDHIEDHSQRTVGHGEETPGAVANEDDADPSDEVAATQPAKKRRSTKSAARNQPASRRSARLSDTTNFPTEKLELKLQGNVVRQPTNALFHPRKVDESAILDSDTVHQGRRGRYGRPVDTPTAAASRTRRSLSRKDTGRVRQANGRSSGSQKDESDRGEEDEAPQKRGKGRKRRSA